MGSTSVITMPPPPLSLYPRMPGASHADGMGMEAHSSKADTGQISEEETISQYSDIKLRNWNRVATALHFSQFAFMTYAAIAIPKFADFQLNLTYSYFKDGDNMIPKQDGLVNATGDIGSIRIAPLIASFFFLSALFQGATTMDGLNAVYNADLNRSLNRFRWYEYALSSSVMMWVIAMFTGISDICTLITIFGINGCMNLFGLLMEVENSGNPTTVTWRPFWFGVLAGIPPWVSVFVSLFASEGPPAFVYVVFFSYLVIFCLFPVNMVLQYHRVGRWADYRYGEYIYIVLSLVAKTLLGWLVFGGLNQPNSYV